MLFSERAESATTSRGARSSRVSSTPSEEDGVDAECDSIVGSINALPWEWERADASGVMEVSAEKSLSSAW